MRALQITSQDLDRQQTLEESDVGKWCVVINGCIEVFESKEKAEDIIHILTTDLVAESARR